VSVEPAPVRSDLLRARVSIPHHVVHRAFPTETVVLSLQTGKYHGLNPVAGRMLEELERQETVKAAAAIIADEYGQPSDEVERDLCQLCIDLARRGLVVMDVGAGP
jgi:Coenzyme PQQ synthesis protein D (PqqD)